MHAAFGRRFALSGDLDPKLHRWLLDAFDLRISGDYGFEANLSAEDAATQVARAREFVRAAEAWLSSR